MRPLRAHVELFIRLHRVAIVILVGSAIFGFILIWLAMQGADQAKRADTIRTKLDAASLPRPTVPTPSLSPEPQDEISLKDRLGLEKDLLQIESTRYVAGAQLAIGLLVAAGGLGGLYFTRKTLQTNQRGQVTDRFTKAIDQLGRTIDKGEGHKAEPHLEVRLGGLYALERIARDSAQSEDDYLPVVVEVLAAYIRENPPPTVPDTNGVTTEEKRGSQNTGGKPRADIQTAVTILGRLEPKPPPDLSWANLSGANLTKTNLSGANLYGADLTRADLSWADLSRADLTKTNLSGANLYGADLSGANLSGANLTGANLIQANLTGANLSLADLSLADLSLADLIQAWLLQANLSGANLSGANLTGVNLIGADLSLADLSGADLSLADLSGANLTKTNLIGADLSLADLSLADLIQACLIQANLSGANLSGSNLSRANLSGANLSGANLTKTNLSGADLYRADLTRADYLVWEQLLDAWVTGATRFPKYLAIPEHIQSDLIREPTKRLIPRDVPTPPAV